jgi:alpha-tubulin suppressor-like RCC1 family protein
MVEISKNTLISKVDDIISSLDPFTEETEVLSLIYKTAINAGANANTIATELTSRIESATSNTDITEILTFSVITDIITADREVTVANIAALDALTNISTGSVYYVESLEVPYIKTSIGWEPVEFNSQLGEPIAIGNFAYAWGNNTSGQLGDNSTVNQSSPVSVVGGFANWTQISAGVSHSLGVRANGTAWAWGSGAQGQLGDNTIVSKSSPVSVVGGFTDWTQVSASGTHSLGVRANGTAWAWGCNNQGQLGDNTTVSKRSPVLVAGGFTDWVQVSGGNSHSLGLRENGTAWGWGYNGYGNLGDGTTVSKRSPVSVVGGFTDWSQVSAGRSHSLGVRANGTAWAWGADSFGRLGDNSPATFPGKSSPVSVVGGFTDWTQVSAGGNHSLGVRANGTAWAWGRDLEGQLGTGTTISRSSPVSVVGGFTDWTQVSAGSYHSLGVRSNGTAWAWGSNSLGQLGDNTTVNKSSPISVIEFTDWIQVSAGGTRSLGTILNIG